MKCSEKGFSLIEVIMAMTIMAVVSLGFLNMIEGQLQAIAYMEDKMEKVEIERQVRQFISNTANCSSNIKQKITANNNTSYKIQALTPAPTALKPNPPAAFSTDEMIGKLQIGQISFKNKDIAVPNSSGVITLIVPINRQSDQGLTEYAPVEIELNATVDNNFQISGCTSSVIPTIDPSGLNRDGWLCSCNGDYTSQTEGGATICILEEGGQTTDLWVAPDPWTKATSENFNCNGGTAPTPPGGRPLLKWRYNYYSTVTQKCNMVGSSQTVTQNCP